MIDQNQIVTDMEGWLNSHPVPSYREIIRKWGNEFITYRLRMSREDYSIPKIDYGGVLFNLRDKCIQKFGFSIPCLELLDVLEQYQPLVEIGAGTGFITALAKNHGIDIIGTDPRCEKHWFDHGLYDHDQIEFQGKTAVRHFSDRNVFCSWPSYQRTWFRQALKAMKIGCTLIIVDEDCCAEDTAKEYLQKCFECKETIFIPSWPMIHDQVYVYRKVRQNPK